VGFFFVEDNGRYQNYGDLDLGENWGELYWGTTNLNRLKQSKARYDPLNVFHSAQSIPLPQ
jgi:FAD/FMN-containing dehydrogenase